MNSKIIILPTFLVLFFTLQCVALQMHDTVRQDNLNKFKNEVTILTPGEAQTDITITILYDNYLFSEGTKPDWGFSCLIEGMEKTILFDTGTSPAILWHNINYSGADMHKVQQIVISHNHADHTGGLLSILEKNNNVRVYLPYSSPDEFVMSIENKGAQVLTLKDPGEICKNAFLTGEMGEQIKEQSLILNTKKGLIVVTGCSHPGIVNIVKRSKEILDKDIYLVFGGFHLMSHSDEEIQEIIQELRNLGVHKCGPSHCSGDTAINLFKNAYMQNFIKLGTGLKLNISD